VEDVEAADRGQAPAESDLGPAPGGHRAGPQVIFNRTLNGADARSRTDVRRTSDQRAREGRGGGRPLTFSTALDPDFLSLFAT